MAKQSAGLLMFREREDKIEVFLVHPGGPYWKKKDLGAWSIPKGEYSEDEDPLNAAEREFEEETGFVASGDFLPLQAIKQRSGKVVRAWAFRGDCVPEELKSNTFSMEWPPKSGKQQEFPEIDRGAWFSSATAKKKILASQADLIDELCRLLGHSHEDDGEDTEPLLASKHVDKTIRQPTLFD